MGDAACLALRQAGADKSGPDLRTRRHHDAREHRRPSAVAVTAERRSRPLSGDSRLQVGARRRPIRGQGSRPDRKRNTWPSAGGDVQQCRLQPDRVRSGIGSCIHMQERSSADPGAAALSASTTSWPASALSSELSRLRRSREGASDRPHVRPVQRARTCLGRAAGAAPRTATRGFLASHGTRHTTCLDS